MSEKTASAGSPLARSIRAALEGDSRIRAWQLTGVRRTGVQTYLVKTQLESERRTQGESYEVTVFVANGDMLGRANATLGAGDDADVKRRIDDAVYMAGLGGDAPWALPASGAWPKVEAFDPALAGRRRWSHRGRSWSSGGRRSPVSSRSGPRRWSCSAARS